MINKEVTFSEGAKDKEISKYAAKAMAGNFTGHSTESCINMLLSDETDLIKWKDYPLYIAIANQAASMEQTAISNLYRNNNRLNAWNAIVDGLRNCPLLILRQIFEINDATSSIPYLVLKAKSFQTPFSYQQNEFTRLSSQGIEDEEVIRWWNAYDLLDKQKWIEARGILQVILEECDRGRWPMFYKPEALYWTAVSEFGLNLKEACHSTLKSYFRTAFKYDRNIADAKLLFLWSKNDKIEIPTLQYICYNSFSVEMKENLKNEIDSGLCLAEIAIPSVQEVLNELPSLDQTLSIYWDEDTFSNHTWVRSMVSKALDIKTYEDINYQNISTQMLNAWKGCKYNPPHLKEITERISLSGSHGVVVRFRHQLKMR